MKVQLVKTFMGPEPGEQGPDMRAGGRGPHNTKTRVIIRTVFNLENLDIY